MFLHGASSDCFKEFVGSVLFFLCKVKSVFSPDKRIESVSEHARAWDKLLQKYCKLSLLF